MINFTPEYIALAKNEKVQELRPEIEIGDWLFWNNHIELNTLKIKTPFKSDFIRSHVVFIPNGDQLDDEIVKICKDKGAIYKIYFDGHWGSLNWYISLRIDDSNYYHSEKDTNPLIAKISLLIKLLEAQ